MRYWEYALLLLPSPPRYRDSSNSSFGVGIGNGRCLDRSNRESNVHAQHGIDKYPDALERVESTGTHGVSSSAWFPIRNAPGTRYGCKLGDSRNVVGSSASTCK